MGPVGNYLLSTDFAVTVLIWIASAIAAGLVAQWKGRNPVSGFLMGLCLSVIGLAIVLFWRRGLTRQRVD